VCSSQAPLALQIRELLLEMSPKVNGPFTKGKWAVSQRPVLSRSKPDKLQAMRRRQPDALQQKGPMQLLANATTAQADLRHGSTIDTRWR
jgi:hypothetical protein